MVQGRAVKDHDKLWLQCFRHCTQTTVLMICSQMFSCSSVPLHSSRARVVQGGYEFHFLLHVVSLPLFLCSAFICVSFYTCSHWCSEWLCLPGCNTGTMLLLLVLHVQCNQGLGGDVTLVMQIKEQYPLTGEVRQFKRRDLRKGTTPLLSS